MGLSRWPVPALDSGKSWGETNPPNKGGAAKQSPPFMGYFSFYPASVSPAFPIASNAWIVDHFAQPGRTSYLPRLENGKVIGVDNEDAPEEPRRQDAVDPLEAGV